MDTCADGDTSAHCTSATVNYSTWDFKAANDKRNTDHLCEIQYHHMKVA
jgi:hypothetical protein